MENVQLRHLSSSSSRNFTHDGQDPWADDVSDLQPYHDEGDGDNLLHTKKSMGSASHASLAPMPNTPSFARGHGRSPSKQSFLQGDSASSILSAEENNKGPWLARLRGWRVGAANCVTAVITVFLVNLALTIWVATAKGWEKGIGVMYEGAIAKRETLAVSMVYG